jgi:hypothetical protein
VRWTWNESPCLVGEEGVILDLHRCNPIGILESLVPGRWAPWLPWHISDWACTRLL